MKITADVMETTNRRADELQDGDMIIMRVSSIERTATGYVMFRRNGTLEIVPPDTVFPIVTPK